MANQCDGTRNSKANNYFQLFLLGRRLDGVVNRISVRTLRGAEREHPGTWLLPQEPGCASDQV